jgi:hypothetical protein
VSQRETRRRPLVAADKSFAFGRTGAGFVESAQRQTLGDITKGNALSPSEAVQLAKDMRAAGASRFSFADGKLSVVFLPPEPPRMMAIAEAFGELPAEHRDKFLKEQKKLLDADLFGSSS